MASASEKNYFDDIIRKVFDLDYCVEEVTVYNRTNGVISPASLQGQPLEPDESQSGKYMFCIAARASYCTAILLSNLSLTVNTMADNATLVGKALVRGPAIIDKTQIPATDVAAANITAATIVTALEALNPPILSKAEHTVTATQTT